MESLTRYLIFMKEIQLLNITILSQEIVIVEVCLTVDFFLFRVKFPVAI